MMTAQTMSEPGSALSDRDVDAVQNAIRPARARFVGMDSGALLFRSLDPIDSSDHPTFERLANEIMENLLASTDETVRSVIAKADRIGIV